MQHTHDILIKLKKLHVHKAFSVKTEGGKSTWSNATKCRAKADQILIEI